MELIDAMNFHMSIQQCQQEDKFCARELHIEARKIFFQSLPLYHSSMVVLALFTAFHPNSFYLFFPLQLQRMDSHTGKTNLRHQSFE